MFSFDGELRFGYNSSGLNPDDSIVDCYCAAWGQARRLFFYPYPDFRLVSIDLQTMTHELWPTPSLRGFAALTVGHSVDGREILFFHAPYSAGGPGSGIYRWRIGDDAFEPVGEYPGLLRGLRGGRFLASGPEGYTIISPGSVE